MEIHPKPAGRTSPNTPMMLAVLVEITIWLLQPKAWNGKFPLVFSVRLTQE